MGTCIHRCVTCYALHLYQIRESEDQRIRGDKTYRLVGSASTLCPPSPQSFPVPPTPPPAPLFPPCSAPPLFLFFFLTSAFYMDILGVGMRTNRLLHAGLHPRCTIYSNYLTPCSDT